MYREQIIDLYENPLNYGEIDRPSFTYEEDNPLCGDVIRIDVVLDDDNRVADVKWSGDGCAISQAAASLLTDEIKAKRWQKCATLTRISCSICSAFN